MRPPARRTGRSPRRSESPRESFTVILVSPKKSRRTSARSPARTLTVRSRSWWPGPSHTTRWDPAASAMVRPSAIGARSSTRPLRQNGRATRCSSPPGDEGEAGAGGAATRIAAATGSVIFGRGASAGVDETEAPGGRRVPPLRPARATCTPGIRSPPLCGSSCYRPPRGARCRSRTARFDPHCQALYFLALTSYRSGRCSIIPPGLLGSRAALEMPSNAGAGARWPERAPTHPHRRRRCWRRQRRSASRAGRHVQRPPSPPRR